MYVLELKKGVASEEKGGAEYKYLSIGLLIDEEIKELDRKFFGSKEQSALTLIELSQKRAGKDFKFEVELKTEVSKKKTEYSYLSVKVPLDGKYVEAYRHFIQGEAMLSLIASSEAQYPTTLSDKK